EGFGLSPFQLLFGLTPSLPPDIESNTDFEDVEKPSERFRYILLMMKQQTKHYQVHLNQMREAQAALYDERHVPSDVKIGDQVFLHNPFTPPGESSKLYCH